MGITTDLNDILVKLTRSDQKKLFRLLQSVQDGQKAKTMGSIPLTKIESFNDVPYIRLDVLILTMHTSGTYIKFEDSIKKK